jgi:hypothetical protein
VSFLEPFVIPGFDRVVLKLLIIFSFIIVTGIVVTISSIIGVIRAVRRRRRGTRSKPAVILAAAGATIAISWLLYWVGSDIADRSNPINGLLGINFALCVLPLSWLVAAVRANVVWRKRME